MKTKFKPCGRKPKDPFGDTAEGCKGISPCGAAYYKHNLDFFNKLYKDTFKNRIHHCKKTVQVFEKSVDTNKSCEAEAKDGIDILPASGHDICNYLARYSIANAQIQAVMKLDGRLDFDKLKRAVRLSVDAEPVFGCRFIEDDPPYWKRLDNIDEIAFCSLEETDNSDEAVMKFLQSPLDMDNDPNVKVKLIRSEQYDVLGVKVNHACCDGKGTKEYIQLLADIYSRIGRDNGGFIPEPRIGGRKDQDRLFKELGITHPEFRWNPLSGAPKTMWPFPWKQRGGDSVCFAICRLPQGSLESIHQYGKSKGATVNDLILTALYRTMFRISNPVYGVPMDISSTIDLRRYLPEQKTQAIRNFSGGFITKIARVMNEPFNGTLTRVMRTTKKIKDRRPGLNSAMGGEYMEKTSFTYFNHILEPMAQVSEMMAQYTAGMDTMCCPALSNVGYISDDLIRFGENVVTDAYIMPPAVRIPGFLLLVSSYNGVLTLSIGYYKGSISQKAMECLLNTVKNELLKGCEV